MAQRPHSTSLAQMARLVRQLNRQWQANASTIFSASSIRPTLLFPSKYKVGIHLVTTSTSVRATMRSQIGLNTTGLEPTRRSCKSNTTWTPRVSSGAIIVLVMTLPPRVPPHLAPLHLVLLVIKLPSRVHLPLCLEF